MKQAAGGSAYGFGVVQLDGAAANQNCVGTEGVCTSDHCANVARITYLIAHHYQPRTSGQRLSRCDVDHLADRNDALWRHGIGELVDRPSRCGSDANPEIRRGRE